MAHNLAQKSKIRRFIDFDKDDIDWYESAYKSGTLNWLMSMLLKKFREAHKTTPDELAKMGAEELKRQLLNGDTEPEERME